ncbi:MAG: MOSC domain-containing protein [Actinobacteria bacterium]|nr:MOSC domain-containing protein [Actinomycetota bacterium]
MKKLAKIRHRDNSVAGENGKIFSINISKEKGVKKYPVAEILITKFGLEGDGHCGDWHRQISLLSYESIKDVIKKGIDVSPGDFAENITTAGIKIQDLKIGDLIIIDSNPVNKNDVPKNNFYEDDENAVLKVTQIGKECINPCRIYYQLGSCIMPSEGIFCRVIKTGKIKVGDKIYGENI